MGLAKKYYYQSGELEIVRRNTLQMGSISGDNVGILEINDDYPDTVRLVRDRVDVVDEDATFDIIPYRANNKNYYGNGLQNLVLKNDFKGKIVRLGDVAKISDQFSETPISTFVDYMH